MIKDLITSQNETKKMFQETDEQIKATNQRVKEAFDLFEGQWGKLMESLVEGNLISLLQKRGIKVDRTSTRQKGFKNGKHFEFDIIAHNGDEIVVVEVKTTLRVKHVKKFVEQLETIKSLLSEYKNHKIYGAVAFLRAEEESEVFAQNQKLFVIKAAADSADIVNASGFEPAVF